MSLVNVTQSVFASFDVQLKFESFIRLMFEGRIGPMRKIIQYIFLYLILIKILLKINQRF